MKHFIFDTETSGLPDYSLPADHPDNPRLAHLAGICLDDDDPTYLHRIDVLVKPDGWEMQPGATAVNGLTTEYLAENGVPVAEVLGMWTGIVESGYVVYAYNAQHDCKVMRGELRRAGFPDLFEETRNVCLMRAMMPYGVKKANGKGGFPALSDTCKHFGIELTEAHKGMPDAIAAYHVFLKLRADGRLPAPAVHHASPGSKSHEALQARQPNLDVYE